MTVRDQTDRESLGVVCGHRRCHERQIGSGPEGHFPDGQELREMAERQGDPDMVGFLVISWDSLGHWFFRVDQYGVSRRGSLSEIRRKNAHSVPEWWMALKPDRAERPSRKSGG